MFSHLILKELHVQQTMVHQVLGAAEYLKMDEVVHACVDFLKANLQPCNWRSVLQVAELLKHTDLENACVAFARANLG